MNHLVIQYSNGLLFIAAMFQVLAVKMRQPKMNRQVSESDREYNSVDTNLVYCLHKMVSQPNSCGTSPTLSTCPIPYKPRILSEKCREIRVGYACTAACLAGTHARRGSSSPSPAKLFFIIPRYRIDQALPPSFYSYRCLHEDKSLGSKVKRDQKICVPRVCVCCFAVYRYPSQLISMPVCYVGVKGVITMKKT